MPPIEHIQHLSGTIGPRGSTTPQESRAAEYARETLQRAGLQPRLESFRSARSAWWPYALYSGLFLVGFALFIGAGGVGAWAAAALSAAALASVLLELAFRPNPLRWVLPTAQSHNVWAQVAPAGPPRQQIVLLGHLDSHRTPLAFSSDRWLQVYSVLVPVGLISSVLMLALFVIGALNPAPLWRQLAALPALVLLAIFLITFQADTTRFTAGANDNASGAGVVLGLAERLARQPLKATTVWAALTGCEEVGCYGAEALARAHRQELRGALWLAVDTVGGRGTALRYLTQETFLLTTRSDPGLIDLARTVAAEHPDLGVRPHRFAGAYTEGAIGGKYGHRVLSFIAVRPDGSVPDWHRPSDVFERLDQEVIGRTETFLWEFIQAIDAQVPPE